MLAAFFTEARYLRASNYRGYYAALLYFRRRRERAQALRRANRS